MGRARTRGAVARRIDRLAYHAHAFHRFAHHPLCGRYADEVVRLGRRSRVCRGCALAIAGGAAGGVAGVVVGSLAAGLAGLALALGLAGLSLRARGLPKIASRLLPAAGLSFALFTVMHTPHMSSLGLAVASGACTALLAVMYKRRGPNRTPCVSCPEWGGPRTCSGFRPIVVRERAVMRKAGALIREAQRGAAA